MSGMLAFALMALTGGVTPPGPAGPAAPSSIIAAWVRGSESERPRVSLWLNRDDVYSRGDRARVYFRSDRDAYVTVVRIDTDGRVRILFPIDPWEDNFARGGRTFEVLGRDRDEAFRVDDYPGVGYVFAIASDDPFNYDDLIRGDHWDYRAISDGRVRGDPYVAVSDIAERVAVEGGYDYDVAQYSVEKHYDYPRFVCYDCHAYASWRYWDPYNAYCSRFRIVIYDDWYYYPYRRYSGGVVIVRPYRPGPRYVFKDVDGRNDYITRVAQRPSYTDANRGTVERDRGNVDVGGRGTIPAPVSPRRRTPAASPTQGAEPRRTPERRTQPDAPRDRAAPSREARPEEPAPRRRPSDRTESANLRDTEGSPSEPVRRRDNGTASAPDAGTSRAEPSRRAPDRAPSDRGDTPSGAAPTWREPSRTEPSRREPSRAEPSRREPSRAEPSRAEPSRREPSRAEPSRSQPPRSTGEPQLKRRRPN